MTTETVDHTTEGLALLVSQYKGAPRLEGYLSALLDEVQALEAAIQQVKAGYHIDDAVGAQLDVLGRIVGQPRIGQDDESFRTYVLARVAANKSSGRTKDLLNVVRLATSNEPNARHEFWRSLKTFVVFIEGISRERAQAIADLLGDAAGATRRVIVSTTPAVDTAFRWDSGPGWDVGLFANDFEGRSA